MDGLAGLSASMSSPRRRRTTHEGSLLHGEGGEVRDSCRSRLPTRRKILLHGNLGVGRSSPRIEPRDRSLRLLGPGR